MTTDKTPIVSRETALDAVCQHRSHAAAAAALGITAPALRQALHSFPPKPARKPRAPKAPAAPAPEPQQPAAPSTADLQATIARLEVNAALQASMIERLMAAAQKPARAQASTTTAQVRRADPDEEYEDRIFGVEAERERFVLSKLSANNVKVLAIGDTHFHPGLPQTLRLMSMVGHHAAAVRPDHVLHIGDGSDWNSCCHHVKDDTWKARSKPSVRQDIVCFRRNWEALNAPMDAADITASRHYCMGNHDKWLWDEEDRHPANRGSHTEDFMGILRDAGWSTTDFGEMAFIGGVGFTHVPRNLMGKAFGGQMPENAVAGAAVHDVVFGHTHRFNSCRKVKVGFSEHVLALNVGGCMPRFYVGDYAHHTQGSAVTSGVVEIDISRGRIQGFRFVETGELEARYGHLVEQGRA